MNVQDELKALKERITELEEQVKEEQDEREREFPQNGDDYWRLDNDAEVMEMEWCGNSYDKSRLSIGNIFRTEEQAKFAVEKLKVEAELRKFSRPFELDAGNILITFNTITGSLNFLYRDHNQSQGAIYFESVKKAQQAIDKVGTERIKKYIFGVEAPE